jgi:hypothetical protein
MENIGAVNAETRVHAVSSQLGLTLLQLTFRTSLVLTTAIIFLVGIWAVAALIGGTVAAGGPLGLVMGWFSAVSGL